MRMPIPSYRSPLCFAAITLSSLILAVATTAIASDTATGLSRIDPFFTDATVIPEPSELRGTLPKTPESTRFETPVTPPLRLRPTGPQREAGGNWTTRKVTGTEGNATLPSLSAISRHANGSLFDHRAGDVRVPATRDASKTAAQAPERNPRTRPAPNPTPRADPQHGETR